MGTFVGHVLPGSFFLMFGIWWTIQISRLRNRLLSASKEKISENQLKNSIQYFRTAYPCFCRGRYVPIESIFKVIFTFAGMCGEYGIFFKSSIGAAEWQHVVMYAMFMLNGITEIMTLFEILIPKGADYFTGMLALFSEAVLFLAHVQHDKNPEQQVHLILIITILLTCVTVMIEAWIPGSVGFKYVRAFLVTLQGTWFFQVAFLIYNPIDGQPKVWHSKYLHEENMWLSIMYCTHCIVVLLVQLSIMVLIRLCNKCGRKSASSKTRYKPLNNSDLLLLGQNHAEDVDEDEENSFNLLKSL